MLEHWKEIGIFVGVCGTILTMIIVFIKYGAKGGSLSSQVCSHKKWLGGHETRIQDLERKDYMTEEEHREASDRCLRGLDQRRSEDRDRLEKVEDIVHETREMMGKVEGMFQVIVKGLN